MNLMIVGISAGGEFAGPCADGEKKKAEDADKVIYLCYAHAHRV